ncbi:DUF2848 family protein [Roseococcus sp. DSY-14]|uniref:DUF2848 family protein n=1 Tax=Roseococcus sp. DSY-14 TaxID=3369650 RepID=UPI00387A9137
MSVSEQADATPGVGAPLAFEAGGQGFAATIHTLVIAGWAGRDAAAVQHHIEELAAIGVKPPREMPLFYRVSASLLTQAPRVQLAGKGSTGEAEAVFLRLPQGDFIAVGSDHTDRAAEAAGVTWSKQMCAKPLSRQVFRWAEVRERWDGFRLSARIRRGGEWLDYQAGTVAALRHPDDLLRRHPLPVGGAMFLGTLATHGAIAWADEFAARLEDPQGGAIECRYAMDALPIND